MAGRSAWPISTMSAVTVGRVENVTGACYGVFGSVLSLNHSAASAENLLDLVLRAAIGAVVGYLTTTLLKQAALWLKQVLRHYKTKKQFPTERLPDRLKSEWLALQRCKTKKR